MSEINIGAISEALNNKVDLPTNDSQDGIDFVVDWQNPTADNSYTWYRKYKSGWVEQGGYATAGPYNAGTTITLPIIMADTGYTVLVSPKSNAHYSDDAMYTKVSISQIQLHSGFNGNSSASQEVCWEVKGIAA